MAKRLVRFTDSAHEVLRLGQLEAARLGHGYVGVDHLLMGLMREQMGIAGIVLRKIGLDLEDLEQYASLAKEGPGPTPARQHKDLSPACKRAINQGIQIASTSDAKLVGTEHLLLGLISQPEGRAAHLLHLLGLSVDLVQKRVWEALDDQHAQARTPAPLPDDSLEQRFRIEEVVGIGSSSTVYRAQDLSFKDLVRTVAVKEMRVSAVDEEARAAMITSFQEEAGILAALKHPFIPRFYDFLCTHDRFYIVMEYIEGRDLETIINESEHLLSLKRVLRWGLQLCDVLHYLHHLESGPIIFRDLKPSNVMIDRHDNIRLIDFNIARILEPGRIRSSVGTPGYSPPEQYQGQVSPQVDIYALGATLHYLLSGQDPRLAPEFSFDQRLVQDHNPQVSVALETVVQKAVAYRPEERYDNIEHFRRALSEHRPGTDMLD